MLLRRHDALSGWWAGDVRHCERRVSSPRWGSPDTPTYGPQEGPRTPMNCSGTVLSSLAQTVVRAYEDSDTKPASIAGDVLDDVGVLEQPDARLPFAAYAKIWELCAEASGDPAFGIRAALRFMRPGTFGVVGFMARSAPTLRDALECAVRHGPLLNQTSRTLLYVDGDVAIIRDGPADPVARWPRHKAEFVMAAYVQLCLEWAGVSHQPISVSFQHSAGTGLEHLRSVFGAEVTFEAAFNELRFPAAWLRRSLTSAEPDLFEFLGRRAAELGSALEGDRDLLTEIRRVVVDALPGGPPSLERVARILGTGHRTLQRRLQAHDTSYRDLVDDLRFAQCRTLLLDDRLTIDSVSSMLGFSEARAFRRAVRRWSGLSPRGLRERLV